MNITLGVLFLLAGVALLVMGSARGGVPRSFIRGNFVELMYPTLCLGLLVFGVAFLYAGLAG
jgi:hypothetical protein